MPEKSSFHLKKWYFDGVDAGGRAIIAYSAMLTWHGVRVPYASYLFLKEAGDSGTDSRFRHVAEPVAGETVIRWADKGFRFSGQWTAAAPAIGKRLYEGPEGFLDWHCYQPVSNCHIELGTAPPIVGLGYVECLEMTFPPWQLGLRELRWGRFAHPEMPVVWIDWKGDLDRRWIFAHGQAMAGGTVNDSMIYSPDHDLQLRLEQPVVIEEQEKAGALMQSLSAYLPGIDRMAPLRFLKARETKWLSEGTLHIAGQPERYGRVIHELVTF